MRTRFVSNRNCGDGLLGDDAGDGTKLLASVVMKDAMVCIMSVSLDTGILVVTGGSVVDTFGIGSTTSALSTVKTVSLCMNPGAAGIAGA